MSCAWKDMKITIGIPKITISLKQRDTYEDNTLPSIKLAALAIFGKIDVVRTTKKTDKMIILSLVEYPRIEIAPNPKFVEKYTPTKELAYSTKKDTTAGKKRINISLSTKSRFNLSIFKVNHFLDNKKLINDKIIQEIMPIIKTY
jgi:hypothetical protein